MNYGLYLSAAGALTSMHRQDVIANNLANVNTVGYKSDVVTMRQRLPERLESGHAFADSQQLLEQMGGGVLTEPTRVSTSQGPLQQTGSPLDIAIRGTGYFVVGGGSGGGNPGQNSTGDVRLTRDGRFELDDNGTLVMATTGQRVLDQQSRPIHLNPATPVEIDQYGVIRQDGQQVAQLQVIEPANPAALRKAGRNTLSLKHSTELQPARGVLQQGFVEQSSVDPIMALNDLINASKAAQGNLKMMQYHDHTMTQAISTFGRVA